VSCCRKCTMAASLKPLRGGMINFVNSSLTSNGHHLFNGYTWRVCCSRRVHMAGNTVRLQCNRPQRKCQSFVVTTATNSMLRSSAYYNESMLGFCPSNGQVQPIADHAARRLVQVVKLC
jgi:hypothetical protein